MSDRPAIPAQLVRDVEIESGYRCALPTCQSTVIEIAHIIPWEQVRKHEFYNLIALCPTHHTLYDIEKKIDTKAVLQIKANLSVLSIRYTEIERRMLNIWATNANPIDRALPLPNNMAVMIWNLIEDGLILDVSSQFLGEGRVSVGGIEMQPTFWVLTASGVEFVKRWKDAHDIETVRRPPSGTNDERKQTEG